MPSHAHTPAPPQPVVVTGYWPIPSRRPRAWYAEHIARFLGSVTALMVVFGPRELLSWLRDMRPRHLHPRTLFLPLEVAEWTSMRTYGHEFWERQATRSGGRCAAVLAALWAEKQHLVQRAIALLSPCSPHRVFIWCDIGIMRTDAWLPRAARFGAAAPARVPRGQIMVQIVQPCTVTAAAPFLRAPQICIAAGILAGDAEAWRRLVAAYDVALRMYDAAGECACDDQYVLTTAASVVDPSLCAFVPRPPPRRALPDAWMHLLWHLADGEGADA